MTALLRYQSGLLLRSRRWLAPLLLYAVFIGVGVRAAEPVLDALGFAAALLPVTAWTVRICLTQEPPAARNVVAAALLLAAGAAFLACRATARLE